MLPRLPALLLAALAVAGLPGTSAASVDGVVTLEAGPELFADEGFANLAPALALDAGFLQLELAAPFRIRLNRTLSSERGFFRREDWDALSDAGRALRTLDVSLGERTFVGHLGAIAHATLGHGTLVCDFGTALDPDSQPLGLSARLSVGPVAVEAVGGNILGLDVTALAATLEPLSLWGAPNDRMHLGLQAAVDWDARALSAERVGLFGASLDGLVVRNATVKLAPYVDFNTTARGGHGLHAGLLADFAFSGVELSLRGEYRHTRAPYQPEYFDLGYPLERQSALLEAGALELGPVAKADVPWGTNDTWRAELRTRIGPVSFAGNLGSRGRDPYSGELVHDASAVTEVQVKGLTVSAFAAARQFAWGHNPARVLALGEVRYRINPHLHAWTVAGHLYRLDAESGTGTRSTWQLGAGVGGSLGF